MSEQSEAPAVDEARPIHLPVDPVDFEARLLAVERRLDGSETRDQALLEAMEAVRRLTEVLGTLIHNMRPALEPQGGRAPEHAQMAPADFASAISSPPVTPERLASAHARLRETLFSDTAATPDSLPPSRRKSWLRRALKRMAKEEASSAGGVLRALAPAHVLAGLTGPPEVPWPPATAARLVVRGRVRRRIGWERAGLQCTASALSDLVGLVRVRASPAELCRAGVRMDPYLALALVAFSIEPRWTAGHRFTLAHADGACLTFHDGARPSASTETPPVPVAATVCCPGPAMLAILAGEGATVDGDRGALELVQGWFARASTR